MSCLEICIGPRGIESARLGRTDVTASMRDAAARGVRCKVCGEGPCPVEFHVIKRTPRYEDRVWVRPEGCKYVVKR